MTNHEDEGSSKRQRVSRACDLCRRKKIKCDGLAPVCSNCQAFNLHCSYNDMTKKRGPPKGYIEAIENRLQRLEGFLSTVVDENDPRSASLLAELNSPLETANGEQIKSRPVRRQLHHNGRTSQSSSSSQATSEFKKNTIEFMQSSPVMSPGSTLGEDVPDSPTSQDSANDSNGQLTMDEAGHVRYLGKSSGYYLLQNSRSYQNGAFHFSRYGHQTKAPNRIIPPKAFEIPPEDLSQHLIELYFQNFYPFLPLFYKRHLVPASKVNKIEFVSPLLLNAIYAVASRLSSDVRVRSDPSSPDTAGDIFFERAKFLLDDYYDTPRTSTVQALLLLSSHQQGVMKSARAWLYSGMAFRMAQDLGLHRNCEHWDILPEERERRKRTFWCCFIVDRMTSAIYGRSSCFEEADCDVPFPSMDDDDKIVWDDQGTTSSLLETFKHTIKICDILGHVLKHIYYAKARHHGPSQHMNHVLNALNGELTTWLSNLPPPLQYKPSGSKRDEPTRSPPVPIAQMHMIYYTTVILLHRSFIPGSAHGVTRTSQPSYQISIHAANAILDIVNSLVKADRIRFLGNHAIYCIFTAGIVFIKLASSHDAEKVFDAKVNINMIMRALDKMEETWLTASRSCNILGELAGLRDIKLERNEYVPQKQPEAEPSPSIAVPNSPKNKSVTANGFVFQGTSNSSSLVPTTTATSTPSGTSSSWSSVGSQPVTSFALSMPNDTLSPQQPQTRNVMPMNQNAAYPSFLASLQTASNMDPFAARGTVLTAASDRTLSIDPSNTAFWGIPSSLDDEEWSHYLAQGTMAPPSQPPPLQQHAPLIPSHQFFRVGVTPAATTGMGPGSAFAMPSRQDLDLSDPKKFPPSSAHRLDMLAGASMSAGNLNTVTTNAMLLDFLGSSSVSTTSPSADGSKPDNRPPNVTIPTIATDKPVYW